MCAYTSHLVLLEYVPGLVCIGELHSVLPVLRKAQGRVHSVEYGSVRVSLRAILIVGRQVWYVCDKATIHLAQSDKH